MKKRSILFAAMLMVTFVLASCHGKNDDEQTYKDFVGTWGVEQLDYYNIDYAGAPIEISRETYYFTPGDMEGGLDLVFREDKTGEMRDRSIDTFYIELETTPVTYDTIINPDTTVYTYFDYSYDDEDAILYMNIQKDDILHTYKVYVSNFTKDSFTYRNEWRLNYIEEAKLVRVSDDTRAMGRKPEMLRPRKPGSVFSNR